MYTLSFFSSQAKKHVCIHWFSWRLEQYRIQPKIRWTMYIWIEKFHNAASPTTLIYQIHPSLITWSVYDKPIVSPTASSPKRDIYCLLSKFPVSSLFFKLIQKSFTLLCFFPSLMTFPLSFFQ